MELFNLLLLFLLSGYQHGTAPLLKKTIAPATGQAAGQLIVPLFRLHFAYQMNSKIRKHFIIIFYMVKVPFFPFTFIRLSRITMFTPALTGIEAQAMEVVEID